VGLYFLPQCNARAGGVGLTNERNSITSWARGEICNLTWMAGLGRFASMRFRGKRKVFGDGNAFCRYSFHRRTCGDTVERSV